MERRFLRILRHVLAQSPQQWVDLLELVSRLGCARLMTRWVPFRTLAPYLGTPMEETPQQPLLFRPEWLDYMGWAMPRVSRHLPWKCNCLTQAIAAKRMMTRRGLPCTLYFGVAKNDAQHEPFQAHAWVRCGTEIVTGDEQLDRYVVLLTLV